MLIEYIDEDFPQNPLLPKSPLLRARCRLAIDFINRSICPSFYKYLQEQDKSKWEDLKGQLLNNILSFGKQLLENDERYSDENGDYYLGGDFTLVDIALIPWYIQLTASFLISGLSECLLCWRSIKASNCQTGPLRRKAKYGPESINGFKPQKPGIVLSQRQVTNKNISKYMRDTRRILLIVWSLRPLARDRTYREMKGLSSLYYIITFK